MDKELLVKSGQRLVALLDKTSVRPVVAMWVHYADTDTWRLWLIPENKNIDKREFYRKVAETITANSETLYGLDVSSTEFVSSEHPAIKALNSAIRMDGIGSMHLSGNTINGFYLPEGIALRLNL